MMRIAAFVAVLALATSAFAQEPPSSSPTPSPPEPPPTLAPVVVEGPRFFPERTATTEEAREEIRSTVPGGAEVVGETTIRESLAENLRNVLDFVPGVLIRPRFGLADESQFSIRGSGLQNNFHNRGVNFLFNGFMYGNADGFSDFESIELMDVKHIDVYKGANALRFGANSIGGAVNFVTKTGHDAGLFEYWGEAGSYGFFKQHIATGQVYGPFDVYGGFSALGLEGYRQHSQQQRYRLNTSYGWDFGRGMTGSARSRLGAQPGEPPRRPHPRAVRGRSAAAAA
jgi:iron complex outermembrane recepter protein